MTRAAAPPIYGDPTWDQLCPGWITWFTGCGVDPERIVGGKPVEVDDEAGTVTVTVVRLRHDRPYIDPATDELAVEDLTVQVHGPVPAFPTMEEATA